MSGSADTAEFYARVIRRLGRNAHEGEHGPLDADDAARLWNGVLAGQFTPSQEAALLMGLRVHGESPAMLAAFVRVTGGERTRRRAARQCGRGVALPRHRAQAADPRALACARPCSRGRPGADGNV